MDKIASTTGERKQTTGRSLFSFTLTKGYHSKRQLWKSLWPAIYVINSVDIPNYPVTLSHRRSTTVSLKSYSRYFHNVSLFLDINRGKKYTRRAPVTPLVLSMLELQRTVLWQRFWRDVIRSVWPVLTRFNFYATYDTKKITACKVLRWASFMLFPEAVIQFYAVSTAGGLSLWSAVAIKTRWNGDDGEIAVTFRIMRKICVMFF